MELFIVQYYSSVDRKMCPGSLAIVLTSQHLQLWKFVFKYLFDLKNSASSNLYGEWMLLAAYVLKICYVVLICYHCFQGADYLHYIHGIDLLNVLVT